MKTKPFPSSAPWLLRDNHDYTFLLHAFRQTHAQYLHSLLLLDTNSSILHTVLYFDFLTYLHMSDNVPDQYIQKYCLIFIAVLYPILWKYYNLSNQFLIDKHLGCFPYFAITLHSAMTIFVHRFLHIHVKLSVG